MKVKEKKINKSKAFLTGFIAFTMTVSWFYGPKASFNEKNTVEAAINIGTNRTFAVTGTNRTGNNIDKSFGVLGTSPTFNTTDSTQIGIYLWTVPETGYYRMSASGASGGNSQGYFYKGGKGTIMEGSFYLTQGTILKILVGQKPSDSTYDSGGGGGTFITTNTNSPLLVAGGGGGAAWLANGDGMNANTSTSGTAAKNGIGTPGTNGEAGFSSYNNSAGAGLTGNVLTGSGTLPKSFVNGGVGGVGSSANGGFGGGGGASGNGWGGGGGGGYSGGAAIQAIGGGGGGSYNAGVDQVNLVGNTGNGAVTITHEGTKTYYETINNYARGMTKTFNNTGTDRVGTNTDYSSGTLGGNVLMDDGKYIWTVPETGYYEVETRGAQGGKANAYSALAEKVGGLGAIMKGTFFLEKGKNLRILVGQQGGSWTSSGANSSPAGGGGGTFVTLQGVSYATDIPLIVAGGGGGAYVYNSALASQVGQDAATVPIGIAPNNLIGGVNGAAGGGTNEAIGGAGFFSNSSHSQSGFYAVAYVNGGYGANAERYWSTDGQFGGFGGGGTGGLASGGGGGYSGGAAGTWAYLGAGGGGGSYNEGTIQRNTVGNLGHGKVTITQVLPTITTLAPTNETKFQNNYIDVNWTTNSGIAVTRYDIRAGTTSGGTDLIPVTNKGITTSQRIAIPAGTPGNTKIYWQVRAYNYSDGTPGPWKEGTLIYSNNVPKITATTNTPASLNVSLEKRNYAFRIDSLIDSDDFNYVSLFADVLDANGTVISGSKKQIVLDSSLVSSSQLISGTATEKDGSLQGPFDHQTPFNLKLALQPDFTNGTFDLTLTKSDGVTNVIKSGAKLLTGRSMQTTTDTTPESYTLRIYPEDRQNTNALSASSLSGVAEVTEITMPFTADTRNYLPNLTNVKHDVAGRVFSDAEGFNRISVTGRVDDSDPSDKVTMYYEVQPKASNYSIQVTTTGGKVVPRYGTVTETFNPMVNDDFAFTYQIASDLDSGEYALLVYGYDSQEGIGDYFEIPFKLDRGAPTIDFVSEYQTASGQKINMSSAQKQIVAENNKAKIYFTPNNYATFEYAGYLVRNGTVKDLRIRGAFTNEVKATFIGIDFGQESIVLLNGEQTDFQLGDVVVFKFKATSATGIVTKKDVRILIGEDGSTFDPINDANLPVIP